MPANTESEILSHVLTCPKCGAGIPADSVLDAAMVIHARLIMLQQAASRAYKTARRERAKEKQQQLKLETATSGAGSDAKGRPGTLG